VLINNAGGTFKTASTTSDGVELTFALNALGAFVLERELHPALAAAKGRVVNLATGFLNAFPLDVDDLVSPRKYSGNAQYGRSKQAVVMMTVEQAKRYAADGVTFVSLHPGIIMGTRFGGGQPRAVQLTAGPIMRLFGLACTLEEAQRRYSVAAFNDIPSGSYLVNGKPAELPKQVKDDSVRTRVYALLEKLAATATP
jgi:NAD(P)-dependent dehydrogenase (short-subunit alcohol dehydrogenase family)